MAGWARFAKGPLRSGSCPIEHSPSRFDVHPLDHLILEALRPSAERIDQPSSALDFLIARAECAIARIDLIRMNERLAIKTKLPAVLGFDRESVGILEEVEHAVKSRNACRPRCKDDRLKRGRDRLSRCGQRQVEVRPEVVRPGDQGTGLLSDFRRCKDTCRSLDHRKHRLADSLSNLSQQMRRRYPRKYGKRTACARNGINVERMPIGAYTVHANCDRHGPNCIHGLDRGITGFAFGVRPDGVFEIEHDEIGRTFPGLGDRSWIGSRQEEHGADSEQIQTHLDFPFVRTAATA